MKNKNNIWAAFYSLTRREARRLDPGRAFRRSSVFKQTMRRVRRSNRRLLAQIHAEIAPQLAVLRLLD